LRSVGAVKEKTVKAIQLLTGLDPRQARELVDKAPVVIKEGVSKQRSEQLIRLFRSNGVELFDQR
jgi:large subunit ribosomal protein L7/L12